MAPLKALAPPRPLDLFRAADERIGGHQMWRDPGYIRVRPTIYALSAEWATLKPWQRYLARVHAYALVNPEAVFSHESAAALLGLPTFSEPREIHVFDPERARSVRYGDVAVHTSLDSREFVRVGGHFATSIADTTIDLARVLPPAFGLAVVDAALATGVPIAELSELAAAQRSRRGHTFVAWACAHGDARSESPGESVSRAVIGWLGFPTPELQVEFRDGGYLDRVDFLWPDAHAVGESDGYDKYLAEHLDQACERIIAEKQREGRLRRRGLTVTRWDWQMTMRASALGDALYAAGVPLIAPPQRVMLKTLRLHPRSFAAGERRG